MIAAPVPSFTAWLVAVFLLGFETRELGSLLLRKASGPASAPTPSPVLADQLGVAAGIYIAGSSCLVAGSFETERAQGLPPGILRRVISCWRFFWRPSEDLTRSRVPAMSKPPRVGVEATDAPRGLASTAVRAAGRTRTASLSLASGARRRIGRRAVLQRRQHETLEALDWMLGVEHRPRSLVSWVALARF